MAERVGGFGKRCRRKKKGGVLEGKKGRKLQKIGRERQGETERETERDT